MSAPIHDSEDRAQDAPRDDTCARPMTGRGIGEAGR